MGRSLLAHSISSQLETPKPAPSHPTLPSAHKLEGSWFMSVRHLCFLANRCRAKRLGQIRQTITAQEGAAQALRQMPGERQADAQPRPCPRCRFAAGRTSRTRLRGGLHLRSTAASNLA